MKDTLDKTRWSAARRVLQATLSLPARFTLYTAALLAIILIPGTQLPPEFVVIASGIGVEALAHILIRIAEGEKVSDDEIQQIVEEAIQESEIDSLLTEDQFQRTVAKLFRQLNLLKYAIYDNEQRIIDHLTSIRGEYQIILGELRSEIAELIDKVDYFINNYQLHPTSQPIYYSPTAGLQYILDRYLKLPFSGRNKEFNKIDSYMADQQNGYIFVTGPSGIGKSTLLCQLIGRLSRQENIFCAYYILSRRDNTASEIDCLRSLCRQLIHYYNLSGTLPNTISELRALYVDLLTRLSTNEDQKLVVALDGLDEAEGWIPDRSLFPLSLAKNNYIIFSARQVADRNWIDNLELPHGSCITLTLGKLNQKEIMKLFLSAGRKTEKLTTDTTFMKSVLGISGGDPFYIQYLIEDIENDFITKSNISKQPLGLKKYLDRWWMEIEREIGKPGVSDLFGYLVVAEGALMRNDLISIDKNDSIDGFTVGTTIEKIRRFIVGNEDSGYVLCHARFHDYVTLRLGNLLSKYPRSKLRGFQEPSSHSSNCTFLGLF